ncbi:MAG: hypothetical protein PHD74_05605, partial [Candidatus Krumholzibacteria bacterium]|nr:hypothetical protein [Candidatus Krumholzibacteria bacterium]
SLTLEGAHTRFGAGSSLFHVDLPDWSPGMDNAPAFPSRPVLNEDYGAASLRYDLNHGSYLSAGAGVRYRDGGADDVDEEEVLGWFELMMDL